MACQCPIPRGTRPQPAATVSPHVTVPAPSPIYSKKVLGMCRGGRLCRCRPAVGVWLRPPARSHNSAPDGHISLWSHVVSYLPYQILLASNILECHRQPEKQARHLASCRMLPDRYLAV